MSASLDEQRSLACRNRPRHSIHTNIYPLTAILTLVLALPGAAWAAPQVKQVRLGLPSGPDTGRSRNGAWAPVYVQLKAGNEGNSQGAFRLVAGTTDGQDVAYRYAVAVPALAAGEERTVLAYLRPGNDGSEALLTLETADGHTIQTIRRPPREAGREIVAPRDVFYLALGAPLPGLKRALLPNPEDAAPNAADVVPYGWIEDVSLLPDRWFGYNAADVILLATGRDAFLDQLLADSARCDALLEWVRRGGRLVVSAGHNQQRVRDLLQKVPLLDGALKGRVTRAALPAVLEWSGREVRQPLRQAEVAVFAPGRSTRVLLRERVVAADLDERPLVVEGSCGLGRVVLVAFDLDRPPFTTWDGQPGFWKRLQAEMTPTLPEIKNEQQALSETSARELGDELERTLESFADVPVVSFGWVALFLLLYIALVGPLDYFVLKRMFKRLEFTWITFPLIVVGVSVAAYFTAYHLKGEDLHVNKIDLVEIDLHGPRQVYGRSWFALFSPRAQTYTLGLEPATGWAPVADPAVASPLVEVMANPERGQNKGSATLFRHPYDYAEAAAGLENVPIPVWAARAFAASWRLPLGDGAAPVEVRLRRARSGDALVGTVTNHLPVELHSITLFYRGKWYALGDLVPEESRRVEGLFEKEGNAREFSQWFSGPSLSPGGAFRAAGPPAQSSLLRASGMMKSLLFYQAGESRAWFNSGLRRLDQSWRLLQQAKTYRHEAILVARTAPVSGRAEEVTAGPASPTRLWLDRLPDTAAARPAVPGLLTQETYVRVYVPVIQP